MNDEILPSIKTRHLDIVEKYGGKHGGKAVAAITAAQIAAPLVKRALAYLRRNEDYTITVVGTDNIYPDLHEWVLARIPYEERKAMIASTGENRTHVLSSNEEDDNIPPVRLRYDGSKEQQVEVDGCRVTVNVDKEKEATSSLKNFSEGRDRYFERIIFTASSIRGREAVIGMIESLQKKKYQQVGPPPLLIPGRWGGSWNRRNDLPPRTLDSIILKREQSERLVRDLEIFLKSEDEYGRASQPWHRGYLLHGAPGTGKTSIARALANHFGIAVYYLPLGDIDKDADLMNLVSGIEPKSMILMEDVDVFHTMTERRDGLGTTLAAMLNALDGVWTPHGLITVMTTNKKEELDEALIRAGRVDVDEEFTVLDEDQAERLCIYFTDDPREDLLAYSQTFVGQSPADLIKALRQKQQKEMTCAL